MSGGASKWFEITDASTWHRVCALTNWYLTLARQHRSGRAVSFVAPGAVLGVAGLMVLARSPFHSHGFAEGQVVPGIPPQSDSCTQSDDVFVVGAGGCRVVRISSAFLYPQASPMPGANAEVAALW